MQITVNGQPRQVADATTVRDLLSVLNVRVEHCAVEVNLELVPRTRHAERLLREGDRLEIVTLVGGG